jgi:hypothetical protein
MFSLHRYLLAVDDQEVPVWRQAQVPLGVFFFFVGV